MARCLTTGKSAGLGEVARQQRVDQGVGAPPGEDEIRPQEPFAPEAGLLQDTLRSDVAGLDERLDALEPCLGHRPASEETHCTRAQAVATLALDQPVADLGCQRLPAQEHDNRSE